MNRGWARVAQGSVGEGLAELRGGLAAYESTGARLWKPYFLGLLAQALAKGDRLEEGLGAAEEAVSALRETGERSCAAEIHRVYGELLLAREVSGCVARATDCFNGALAIAREQEAKSWELKVATSLCALARERHEHGRARRAVRETYDWFTEGHQTVDLMVARAVLTT
jgi:predicted ATPase